jgi:hypothetical protein
VLEFYRRALGDGLKAAYATAHARLALEAVWVVGERRRLQAEGKLKSLAPASQTAADQSYLDTAKKLIEGLEVVLKSYASSSDPQHRRLAELARQCGL